MLGTNSLEGLFTAELPVEGFLDERAGHAVTVFVLVSIALAIVNAIIAIALQSGRLLFAAARDRAMPAALAKPLTRVSERTRMPWIATIVMGMLAVLGCLVPIDVLLNATGSTLAFSYGFIALAAIVMRRNRLPRRRGYRMPLWPLPPAIALAAIAGHLRRRCARPQPVAEPRHRAGHHRGRFRLLLLYLRPRAGTHLLLLDVERCEPVMTLDHLITSARVRTFDSATPWAEAVGIPTGASPTSVRGRRRPAGPRRIAAAGRLVTPGIIDSHNHLLLGFDEDAVSLEGAHELGEVRRRIGEFASRRTISTGSARRTRFTPWSKAAGPTPPTSTG